MSHPYTDPWHAGVNITSGQILTNRMMFRKQPGPGMLAGPAAMSGSPLGGVGDAVGEVLGAAGYGRPQPEKRPVASDADPPSQAITSDGNGGLSHVRRSDNGDTVTPVESGAWDEGP